MKDYNYYKTIADICNETNDIYKKIPDWAGIDMGSGISPLPFSMFFPDSPSVSGSARHVPDGSLFSGCPTA